jgi:hypothetical protein
MSVSQVCDADSTGQAAVDCGLHQVRCQERQRYRDIDLTNTAVFGVFDICGRSGHPTRRASNYSLCLSAKTARDNYCDEERTAR